VIISKCELLKAIFFLQLKANRKEENYSDEEEEK